ncbi:MAG: hypothetical protein N2645_15060 [Clostridia bacterium]|nr:hypothetical protein [Clostridia bacterium]
MKSVIEKRTDPSVIRVNKPELDEGEVVIIDGKEEIEGKIYRVKSSQTGMTQEVIYSYRYEAVPTQVQIGPGASWERETDK